MFRFVVNGMQWLAIIGVLSATIARVGSRPKRSALSLIRPMAALFGCNTVLTTLTGSVGYIAASNGWVHLVGNLAENVPKEKHIPFLIDLWAHNASYIGGFIFSIMLSVWVWRSRDRTPNASET